MSSAFLFVCLVFVATGAFGLRYSRNLGLLPSFDDELNVPEDTFQDTVNSHGGGGTDIPVAGEGYMLFGKPVLYLRCWDLGVCECDPTTPITRTLNTNFAGNANGLFLPNNVCVVSPNWISIDAAKSYHVAWRMVDSANINNVKDINRISSEVNRAQHLYTETWNATKAVIITWVITELANTANVDKFQAILALGTQGGVPETYLIYLYESVGNVPDVNPKKGFVLGHYPAAQRRLARVCPSAAVDTLAPSSEFISNSNRKCGHPGIIVFKITYEADACTNAVTGCVDNAGVNSNCNQSSVPTDTCTESVSCRLDANDPTQVTLTIALKWYKFGTLTALDYSDFVAGDETNPTGPQTFVSTPAKCTATLANPGTSTAADTYSVTMALASPECGVDIDTGTGTLKFAYKNYEASHEEEDRDGDLIVYGPCHYNDLQSQVSATIVNNAGIVVTVIPNRQPYLGFAVIDSGYVLDTEELYHVQIGQKFFLGMCFYHDYDFNLNADAYGIHVTTCKVANDASFINDSPGPGPRRSVTFISGGCPVPTGSQGPLSLKRSFEADSVYANTSLGVWCITSGPILAGKWAKKTGAANDKLHFQCVVNFCYVEDPTDLCHDSCPTDPITRRKRGTQSGSSSDLTKTLYTSVQLIVPEDTTTPAERCTNMATVASALACLLLGLGIASAVCVVLAARLTRVRRKNRKLNKGRTHVTY